MGVSMHCYSCGSSVKTVNAPLHEPHMHWMPRHGHTIPRQGWFKVVVGFGGLLQFIPRFLPVFWVYLQTEFVLPALH